MGNSENRNSTQPPPPPDQIMEIYKSLEEIGRSSQLVGYYRVLQRAWKELGLSSVLCVNHVPTLYRIDIPKRTLKPKELSDFHHKFWNQGIASVLLIVDAKSAYIFSGLQPPQKESDEMQLKENDPASPLLQSIPLVEFSQEQNDALMESVTNGEFYRRYSAKFKSSSSVDHYLSENIFGLCNVLTSGEGFAKLDQVTAHNFICRLFFASYLVDRGICQLPKTTRAHLYQALLDRSDRDAIDYLYDFFISLKDIFNGSMFDSDLSSEQQSLSPKHMETIKTFLEGSEVKSRQRTLGFWAYNFKFIPIETISGIYEKFLPTEGRSEAGAYYTPRFLAEMTIDIATANEKDWHKKSYLDPCCGSGVFLVTLFNRLATMWELENDDIQEEPDYYDRKDQALRSILRNQICGMDINESACTLACFSLYVALLDSFEPSDIATYIKKSENARLPRLFLPNDGFKRTSDANDIPTLFADDALTTERFGDRHFDVVIGNPPWGGGRGTKDIARKFLDRVSQFLDPDGSACLLMPSRLFLNTTSNAYQAEWFAKHSLERMVQLADFSFVLFPSADCPCMILKFKPGAPKEHDHEFQYDAPKFGTSSRRQGLVLITEADRKIVPQQKVQYFAKQTQAHTLWKRLFWGTSRDQKFIDYLSSFSTLNCMQRGRDKSNDVWTCGVGFQPDSSGKCKKPKEAWWEPNDVYLPARNTSSRTGFFIFFDDTQKIGTHFPLLRRAPQNKKIFQPPMVLVSSGFNRIFFCDFPVLFQDAFASFHAPEENEDQLLFLTAYLKSDLAKYYSFQIGATMGVERDVVRLQQILDLPFPMPSEAPSPNAEKIVKQVADMLRKEKQTLERMKSDCATRDEWFKLRASRAEELQSKTNELVYQYFDVDTSARCLVEDLVNVFQPSSTPHTTTKTDLPTLCPVNQSQNIPGYEKGIKTYADILSATLNQWGEEQGSKWRVSAKGGVDEDASLALVTVKLGPKKQPFENITVNGAVWKDLYNRFTSQQVALRHERQIFGFLKESFYILRPVSLMHWTRTAALNDADEIFAQIHTMSRGRRGAK